MTENFDFTPKIKKNLYMMMGAGVLGLIFVLLLYPENHHARLWSNILANTYYFTGIGLFGLFVVAATQLAYAGWATLEKRIFLSIGAFARIGGFLLVIILALGIFGVHSLYNQATDIVKARPILAEHSNKVIYFGTAFWIGRVLIYATLWFVFSMALDRFFARTDQTNPKVYKRSKLLCAAFIVVFALTESAISWDMIMSIDTGWYSTLFGWYNFASYGCASWAMAILLVIFLKSRGYLQKVNENHVHDLGKMLFVFSIFWTYLWFDQFMLQWYANIPEETHFWIKRFEVNYFKGTVYLALIINFVFPLLFLMTRKAKRNFKMIGFGAILLIFGHYVDFFNYTFVEAGWNKEAAAKENKKEAVNKGNVMLYAEAAQKKDVATDVSASGKEITHEVTAIEEKNVSGEKNEGGYMDYNMTVREDAHEKKEEGEKAEEVQKNFAGIGIGELLIFIGFLGVFLYMFFQNLAKRPIVPEEDPYLKEAEKLTVTYA